MENFLFAGLDLLGVFDKELDKLEKNRQELANAEKLFDLPITMYPDLMKAQNDMKGLKQIYEIYKSQKVSVYVMRVFLLLCQSLSI